jgi:hypothetical protein
MNDQERWDLEWLKQRHAELQQEMSELAGRLKQLETKQDAAQPATPAAPLPPRIVVKLPNTPQPEAARCAAPAEASRQISPLPIPSPIPPVSQPVVLPASPAPAPVVPQSPAPPTPPPLKLHVEPVQAKFLKCLCAFCGGHIEFPANASDDTIPCPHCHRSTRLSTTVVSPPPIPPRLAAAVPATPPKTSFEMRLGTYWLVRIGIVMLLTGLVFFGSYAYQNYIGLLGPAGKVSLLYAASTILLGLGAWWQRKAARASLKNYAQVLFAGGLAAVYFTTYAAHHIQQLCIIENALLDGALLLAWAGFMAWIADRKKSEVLALFAVGLAYYTSAITRVGSFTLYSNFVLTLAAVFFLVRNRWAVLSLASLVATYATYGFWRFYDGSSWHWASPDEGLWTGAAFLMSYWLCFTAAVFLSKHERFVGPERAGFLTLNNGAFFTMFLLTMLQVHHGGFWKFSLGYGSVLLGLAALARWTLAAEPLTKNSCLTQGLLLATVGLITKFAGLKLALLLGTESVVLLTVGLLRQSLVLQIGAYLSGALAVGWGIASLERNDVPGLYLGAALGALMTFNACWSQRRSMAEDDEYPIRPAPTYFTLLALAIWLATTWYNTTPSNFPLALAVEALVLTFSVYLLRLRELVLLSQGFLLLGQFAWLWRFILPSTLPPWWNPALMIAVTLGLSHWWQRQKSPADRFAGAVVLAGRLRAGHRGRAVFLAQSAGGSTRLADVDQPARHRHHGLRRIHAHVVPGGLWPNLFAHQRRAIFVAAFAVQATVVFPARADCRIGPALLRRREVVPAQSRCRRTGPRTVAANRIALSLDGAGHDDLVGLRIHSGARTNLAAGAARPVDVPLCRVVPQPGNPAFLRGLHSDGAGFVLAAAAGGPDGVLAESRRNCNSAWTTTARKTFARVLRPGLTHPRRRDHYWRTQPLAVSHTLGLPECQRILPDRKLVGAGARVVHRRHDVARTGVSLAWPRHPRFRPGTHRLFRCLETGNALSDSEFHGAWHRAARTRLHLQQIPGEN